MSKEFNLGILSGFILVVIIFTLFWLSLTSPAIFIGEPLPPTGIPTPFDFKYCNIASDCILADRCGQFCYNKKYENWYEVNAGFCKYRPIAPSGSVKCDCIDNICIAVFPER